MNYALRAAHVVAFDGTHTVQLRDATVTVHGSCITGVASGARGEQLLREAAEVIDLGESVLLPGLIDLEGLADIDHLLLDSWWSPHHEARLSWSAEYARGNPREVLTPEERSTMRRYALVQLILHGITSAMPIASEVHSAWAETHDDLLDTALTASKLGLRVFLGPSYRSGVHVTNTDGIPEIFWDERQGEAGFTGALRFLETVQALDDPLITGVLVPCRIETVSDDILTRTAEESARRNVLVRVHATQSIASERQVLCETRNTAPLDLLAQAGLLNERTILAHGVFLDVHPEVHGEDRGDLKRLADAGVSIAHCPLTSARYAFQLEKLSQYVAEGVNVGLGTDSFPPDLIRGIDAGVQVSKLQHGDLGRGALAEYIEAATLGGARALKRPDLGRIAVGATADLVAFSLADLRAGAVDDPVRTLILAGTGRDAHFSMVHGSVVMRDGKLPGVDTEALRVEGQRIFEKLRGAYSERDASARNPSAAELFPPLFPVVGKLL
ncbi:chlorohydrolase family protein [Lysinibacter sp. HNR]|uniref:chlorohydrolase family protein n=1 Tax=Lysinibacter sp. HNR TaxID=3031408 RepID=UPI002435C23F|nr:chlorohydrolase family protein [Lysinibacter sp. HNR]WGD38297.1 chlorohydrolase family protein [Lysinibacter sp. HNR]